MKIFVNELEIDVYDDTTLFELKENFKRDADVIIYNGFPISNDIKLQIEDRVTLIKKGETPTIDELEALMVARHTPLVHSRIKNQTIGIAGAGGLGSNIAISLARLGVKKLIICDFDVVEPSNLNRQQYFVKNIGEYKVKALKDIIKEINPFVEVEEKIVYLNESNITEIYKDCSIVLEAFDNPVCKATIANEVLTKMKRVKLIAGSGMAGFYSSNIIKTRRVSRNFYVCGDEINEAQVGSGLMAPRVAIVANHMVNMALRVLCEEVEP